MAGIVPEKVQSLVTCLRDDTSRMSLLRGGMMIERLDLQYPKSGRSVSRAECYAVRARFARHEGMNWRSSNNDLPNIVDKLGELQAYSIAAILVVARWLVLLSLLRMLRETEFDGHG